MRLKPQNASNRNLLREESIQCFGENELTIDREKSPKMKSLSDKIHATKADFYLPESDSNIEGNRESECRENVILDAANDRHLLGRDLVGTEKVVEQRDDEVASLEDLKSQQMKFNDNRYRQCFQCFIANWVDLNFAQS